MKKFLLTFSFAIATVVAMAQTKTYSDNLAVTIDNEAMEPQETTIIVAKNTDGTYCLSLNNFVLGGMFNVGNIVVDNIQVTEENGIKSFATAQNINITAGEGDPENWMGPLLGEVPVDLKGNMTNGSLYCNIDIELMDQVINVVFGQNIVKTFSYEENLTVNMGGEDVSSERTTIFVDEKVDGTYTLALNDFVLAGEMPVGNIVINGITTTEDGGIKLFTVKKDITITPGTDDTQEWTGPMIGEIPVSLNGKMTEHKLYCNINIENLGVIVTFGQADLSGIENIAGEMGEKVIFDLTGRRVEDFPAPRIYIVNGKKVLFTK